MDLMNLTAEPLKGRYDGQWYTIKPREVIYVTEACGNHLMKRLGRMGLKEVRYSSDPQYVDKLSRESIADKLRFHEYQIMRFEAANRLQKQKDFDPLEEDPAYKEAKIYAPIYKKALARIDKALGTTTEEEDKKAEAEKILSEMARGLEDAPKIEDLDREALVGIAHGLEIGVNPKWNKKTLIKRIKEAQGEESEDTDEEKAADAAKLLGVEPEADQPGAE